MCSLTTIFLFTVPIHPNSIHVVYFLLVQATARESVFNRIVIIPSSNGNDKFDVDSDGYLVQGKEGAARRKACMSLSTMAAVTQLNNNDYCMCQRYKFLWCGYRVFSLNGVLLGTVNSSTSTSITLASGSTQAVVDNEELFYQPMSRAVGTTAKAAQCMEYLTLFRTQQTVYTPNSLYSLLTAIDSHNYRSCSQTNKGQTCEPISLRFIILAGRPCAHNV